MDVLLPIQKAATASRLVRHLRGKLLAGLLALIPLVATVLILRLVFNTLDGMVQPLVKRIFDREIIGVGIGITVIAVYLMGVIATNFLGRAAIRYFESVVLRIPIARWVYRMAKQIVDTLSVAGKASFRVVLVQWPSQGMYTIGFLTGSSVDAEGRTYHNVLVPTTPTPQSGFLAIIPEDQVIFTDLSVEEGIKMVVSSGVLVPKELMKNLKTERRRAGSAAGERADAEELVRPVAERERL